MLLPYQFLSTPSARRATVLASAMLAASIFLSTPSARRATFGLVPVVFLKEFLSTPSARRATYLFSQRKRGHYISIHALREEGDSVRMAGGLPIGYFYPRPPRGGRPKESSAFSGWSLFLSTPSARRATGSNHPNLLLEAISIHALREEGDIGYDPVVFDYDEFLSTPSARRATQLSSQSPLTTANFYPRPPRGGRRGAGHGRGPACAEFLSTPSARRATNSNLIVERVA